MLMFAFGFLTCLFVMIAVIVVGASAIQRGWF